MCRIPLHSKSNWISRLGFDDTAVQLYFLQFSAPKRNLTVLKKSLTVRTLNYKGNEMTNMNATNNKPHNKNVNFKHFV